MISNFSFLLEDRLAGSAFPGSGSDLRKNLTWLYKQGIRGIISLTHDKMPEPLLSECGLKSLHLPVTDFTPPTPQQIDQAVEFIQKIAEEQKEAVLVHCGSGYGRTGTVLACYLVSTGMAADEAIEFVRRSRPGSIETEEQEQAIVSYAERKSL